MTPYWTDATWNPVTGCTKSRQAVIGANCYIERTPPFRMAGRRFVKGAIPVLLHPDRLEQPLRWRKPRRVFVCSLADLFHEDVPDKFIDRIFATMARCGLTHSFQLLTKRPERMRAYLNDPETPRRIMETTGSREDGFNVPIGSWYWPMRQVHLGVSVENQRMADERIPVLLDTPAAVCFLSCEPLLSGLDLRRWLKPPVYSGDEGTCSYEWPPLNWVICGGESGPGSAERKLVERCDCGVGPIKGVRAEKPYSDSPPGHTVIVRCKDCAQTGWYPKPQALAWVRSLRDQCVAAGVPFFFKQWGGPKPGSGGRLLDGRTWDEMPDASGINGTSSTRSLEPV